MKTRIFASFLILLILALILSLAGQQSANADPRVAPGILAELQETGRVDALILLSAQPDLSPAYDLSSKTARGAWVYDTLRTAAEQSQSDLIAELDRSGVSYQRFWLVNAVRAQIDAATLERVLRLETVEQVLDNPPVLSVEPFPARDLEAASVASIPWGVERVDAPWAWEQGITGEGVVVAGQDTGYAWEHEALKAAYRGYDVATDTATHDYNWHDAIHEDLPPTNGNPCGFDSVVPCDDHGHGTHTMGTMVGNNLDPTDPSWPAGAPEAIGVAPGAEWIACRNMEKGVGRPSTYIECYEWFVAPYPLGGDPMLDGDPAKAPDVMNNSWSCITSEGCTADLLDVIEPAVDAADAAGIVVVSSAGNEGSSCGSVKFPSAIYPKTFAVGASNSADALASFSSRGPVTYKGETYIKPDVTAPGVSVRSSFPPNNYGNLQGTSMASPHAAAVIALLLDAEPDLRGDTGLIKSIVQRTAAPVIDFGCGGEADGLPNNSFGWGIVNARQAIESLSQPATLSGQVIDEQDQALAGALVTAFDMKGQFVAQTFADEAGHYELGLQWGRYQITARKVGYLTSLMEPVHLVGGQTTEYRFVLVQTSSCVLPYDFNEDGIVDLDDVLIIQSNSIFYNAAYDPTYDIMPIPGDGVVDIADIFEVALYFGDRCPLNSDP